MLLDKEKARKYVFGGKLEDDVCTISVTPEDNWVRYSLYSDFISTELKAVMEYFGYEKSCNYWEFINESEDRNIADIIDSFNKCPILKYNDEFNDFALAYVYCIGKEEYSEDGEILVYVTPNLYWLNKKHQSDEPTDSYISKYLGALDFEEIEDTTFALDNESGVYNPSVLKKDLDKYKYLKFDESFDKFINKY